MHRRLTLASSFVDVTFRSGVMRCRVRKSQKSGQKFQHKLGAKFLGTNFPKLFTVDNKPIKPSNTW